jgi:hypothetical protein
MKNISYLTLTLALACALEGFGQYNGKRENLGSNINSGENTDSAPVMSFDGKTMYFKRSVTGAGYDYDIYFSKLQADKQWSKAMPVTELNNDKVGEVEYVYPDGKKLMICGTFNGKSGLFNTTNVNGVWTNIEFVDIGMEVDANNDNLNVTMNTRQNVMIVSIHGDLFLSLRDGEKWSPVKEIASLNTTGYEYTPFLDYDDKTLYIAGTGYAGATGGESDIFKVTRTDETWMNWSQPEKVKGNINTDGWDSFFYIPPTKDFIYVYNLNEGSGDILRIKNELPPVPVVDPVVVVNPVNDVQQQVVTQVEEVIATDVVNPEAVVVEEITPESNTDRSIGGTQQDLENILVYPNPTKGQFNIALHNSNETTFSQISILDANLKTITAIGTSQSIYSFDLSEYENGIYFVRIQTNGKNTLKKVVLSK